MEKKPILSDVTEKITDAGDKSGFFVKIFNLLTTPGNPEKIINMAKEVLTTGIRYLHKNNEELKNFEREAAQTRKEVDKLEQMVQANWQKIRKCDSDAEYLQEEERMARLLEEQLHQQSQSTQQKHIGD